ncbi:MAG TPA: PAS domain S-box protein [Mucilaginibacter sp.]
MPTNSGAGEHNKTISERLKSGQVSEDIRFRKLVENSYDGIALFNKELEVVYRSKSAEKLTGWTAEAREGEEFNTIIHPDDRKKVWSCLNRSLKNAELPVPCIYRVKHRQGHFIWLEGIFTNLLHDPDINAILCNFRDITEKRGLEDLLYEANKLSKIGGWEIDAASMTMYWSDITRQIHEARLSYEPTIEESINFYKEGEHRDTMARVMKDAFKNCVHADVELQLVTAKGNEKWVRVIVEPEFFNGKCTRVYGSLQDIDERKRAEIAETKALGERNTILESIGDAFFAVDKNWIVTYWNRMAEKMLGMPKADIIGRNVWDVYAAYIDTESYRKYHLALETNSVVRFEDYFPEREAWFDVSAFPSDNGLSVYFKDITERLDYIKAIEEQNENLKEISWLQSHVIRAPLARIMGLIQLITDPTQDIAEKQNTLNYLLTSAHELDDVIRTITDKTNMPRRKPTSQG